VSRHDRAVTSRSLRRLLPALVAAVGLALVLPVGAVADDGEDGRDVRRTGSCTDASSVTLRLQARDDVIRVELELDSRPGSRWTVILLHERRIVFRGVLRTGRSGGGLRLRRSVPDWFGRDTLVARATGPRGASCRVSAAL
jgi:hypothetical protein